MAREEQAMSEARLAEIRETARQAGQMYAESANEAYGLYRPIEELLAEVERLRAREAALLAVVRAVAEATEVHDSVNSYVQSSRLAWPGLQRASQVREQARALLAAGEQAQGEA